MGARTGSLTNACPWDTQHTGLAILRVFSSLTFPVPSVSRLRRRKSWLGFPVSLASSLDHPFTQHTLLLFIYLFFGAREKT